MIPPCKYNSFLSYADEELQGAPINENHIICNKFTEYFTLGMVVRLSNQLHIDEELLKIESSTDDYQEVWLAECLVCGGRGFFGKSCMKCMSGTYNLSIGVCLLCKKFGVLGVICNHCNQMKYRNLKIYCTNPTVGTVYTCDDESHDELWYDEIQKSFYRYYRERNMIWRFRSQNRMNERYMMDKSENPTKYLSDSDAIMDIEDAYNKIASLYLGADESEIDHLPHDFKVELTDQLAKKNFEKKIIEKFYDHQVNDKQEINKCALNAMLITEDDKSNSSLSNPSNISTAENLADIFTTKKPKTMHPNVEKK